MKRFLHQSTLALFLMILLTMPAVAQTSSGDEDMNVDLFPEVRRAKERLDQIKESVNERVKNAKERLREMRESTGETIASAKERLRNMISGDSSGQAPAGNPPTQERPSGPVPSAVRTYQPPEGVRAACDARG